MAGSKQPEMAEDGRDDEEASLLPKSHTDHSSAHTAARMTVLKRITELAGPMAFANVFGYSLSIVAAVAVGQLNDPVVLSAVVLAGSVFNVTGNSVIIGLSSGLDTIAGQAFGAGNLLMVGESLQRSILICWAVALPVWLLYMNIAPILVYLHQAPAIVEGAQQYLKITGASLFLIGVSNNVNRYLTCQRVVVPGTVCTVITGLLCPLFNWLFIYRLQLGLDGAAWAFLASNFTQALLLVVAMVWRDLRLRGSPQQTWPGLTLLAFQKWGQFLAFGIPAAMQICCEWWVWELVILMAGSLANAEAAVSSMGICFNTSVIAYMLPSAVGGAVNTCIANELGAGHARTARLYFTVGLMLVLMIQVCLGGGMVLLRHLIPRAFTEAADVVSLTAHALVPVGLCVTGDGINALLGGVLRGCGRQAWGAALNLIGYWCVGLPMAILLGFKLHLAVWGFWSALAMAAWIQVCVVGYFVWRLDWQQEVDRAAALTGRAEDDYGADADTQPLIITSGHTGQNGSNHLSNHNGLHSDASNHGRLNGTLDPSDRGQRTGRHSQAGDIAPGGGGVGSLASDLLAMVRGAAGGALSSLQPALSDGSNGLHNALLRHRMSVGSDGSELVAALSFRQPSNAQETLQSAFSHSSQISHSSQTHGHQS